MACQRRKAMTDLEELARMVREDPSLAATLTLEEKRQLVLGGVYQANLGDPYVQKILKQAEAQDHLCSICGEKFEGPGDNAEPAARGRCCKSCDKKTVIPTRAKRLEEGYEYAQMGGGMRDWSKPLGRSIQLEDANRMDDWTGPDNRAGSQNRGAKDGAVMYAEDAKWLNENTNLTYARDGVHEAAPPDALRGALRSNIVPNEARVDRMPGAGKTESPLPPKTQEMLKLPSMNDLVKANLIPDTIAATMERMMTEHFPELMRKYYPRIYENIGRYHSPRQCASFLANVTAESATLGYQRMPTAYKLLFPSLESMARRGMPMFFIAPDLLKAIQLTDFYDDIDWTSLKMPFEQGIFILPKGALTHQDDGDVGMIVWARLQEKTDYPAPIKGWPATVLSNTGFVILGLCLKNGIWYDSTFNANVRPTIQLKNMFYRTPGEHTPPSVKSTNLDADLTEYDEEFLEKLGVITFGTFLAMNAKPELVEKGKLLKRVTKANAAPKEFWSPNIIGPKYRLKREVPKINRYGKFAADQRKRDQGGTHASPRLHWRRGHYRMQAYGVGLKERKQLWIEPVIVGAQTEAEAREAGA